MLVDEKKNVLLVKLFKKVTVERLRVSCTDLVEA